MRRLLVTGASGFVGRHLLPVLGAGLAPGDRLVAVRRGQFEARSSSAEDCQLDLLDVAGVDQLVSNYRPTSVLHLAALSSVQMARSSPAEAWDNNFNGTMILAKAVARYAPACHFCFASSGEVYGRAFLSGNALDEATPPEPLGTYARSKLAAEFMLDDVLTNADITILRPFNHTGAGQDERFVIPAFATQIARIERGIGPPFLEVGNLSAQRDFLDVRDVVEAYRLVIFDERKPRRRHVFNIASQTPRKIGDLLDYLRQASRVPFEIKVMPDRLRPSDIPVACGNYKAFGDYFEWKPDIPIEVTLQNVLDHARKTIIA